MLELIQSVNSAVNNFIWGVPAMICIIGVGLLLTIKTKFLPIRLFPDMVKALTANNKNGKDEKSSLSSLQTLIVKFTAALTSLFIGFALERTGYIPNPNAVQSALTLNSIRFLMCAIPAVSMLVAYVVYKKAYHLDDIFMKKVIQTIEERRANRNAEQY